MRKSIVVMTLALAAGIAAWVGLAGRQTVPLSQLGAVTQVVNTTTISVHYSRPVAKGRTLFGQEGVVPFGEFWSPGANDATWLEVDKDVLLAGQPVPTGRYSLWAIPGETEWTVALSNEWNVFHIPYPGEESDFLRLSLPVESGDHFEVMTFHFSRIGPADADLTLQWGGTRVVFPIEVEMELPAPG